ncbi:hypothetical protein GCM10020219_001040 [Nonomuraea dietziae]
MVEGERAEMVGEEPRDGGGAGGAVEGPAAAVSTRLHINNENHSHAMAQLCKEKGSVCGMGCDP